MENLVTSINNLGQRTWVDYLAIFAPIVLSVVAVWVSIATTKKQNKIALFKKRYEAYTWLLPIMRIGKQLMEIEDKNMMTLDEKGRARRYFMVFGMDNFISHKYPHMNLTYTFLVHNSVHYGYQIKDNNNETLNTFSKDIIVAVLKSTELLRQSTFLFPKSIYNCLYEVSNTYENFMLSVVERCDFNSQNDSYKENSTFGLGLEREGSRMENRRRAFQEAINTANQNQIISQIKKLLQLSRFS